MNLILNVGMCGILALLTVGAYVYRRWLENHCDHYIHLHNDSHDSGIIATQSSLCRRLDMMDKLKTGLLVATIAYAVCVAAIASYSAWTTQGGV